MTVRPTSNSSCLIINFFTCFSWFRFAANTHNIERMMESLTRHSNWRAHIFCGCLVEHGRRTRRRIAKFRSHPPPAISNIHSLFSQSINKPFVYVECLKLMAETRRVLEIRNFFVLKIVNTHVSEAFELAIAIVLVVVVHTATMRSIKLYEKLWALGTRDKSRTSERGERRKNWKFSGEEVILWKNKMFYVNYFKNFYIRIVGAFCVVVDRTKIYREWKSLIFMTFSESNWIELNAELGLLLLYFGWLFDTEAYWG